MPDDHSDVVPLLPIPNRTVKRVSADDSAGSRVKVGHCQAITARKPNQTVGLSFFEKRSLKKGALFFASHSQIFYKHRTSLGCSGCRQIVEQAIDEVLEIDGWKKT